jgi:hypothetical protein
MTTHTAVRPVVLGQLAVLIAAACSSAAAPTAPPATTSPASPSVAPSIGAGGGSSGDPGGTDPSLPVANPADPTPVDPGFGQAKRVIPRPGQVNPRPVGVAKLEPAVDGHRVVVRVTWWSGVEPCNVLDSVKVDRSGTDITIQLIEGSADPGAICIEIAEQKATIVDLGELEPGTYTIFPDGKGEAKPVTAVVA